VRLAICGPGRSGKDTAALWLKEHTTLRYNGSTSEAAAQICFEALRDKYGYASAEEAFADRHAHREEWANLIWDYNLPDGLTLYTDMLRTSDVLNGIRRGHEIRALQDAGLIDLTIWIDRDVMRDPSCELAPTDCDIVIQNRWTVVTFHRRLARFAKASGILRQ
jgi:hypothetical protein